MSVGVIFQIFLWRKSIFQYGHIFSYDSGGDFGSNFSMITNLNEYFSGHIFSYDYGGDYGGFFGSGFPSLFGAPRVRVVVVPVDEV